MHLDSELCRRAEEISLQWSRISGTWRGCDWPTLFGRNCFNLQDMSAAQAVLMARATAGVEADEWWAASRWLARVEGEAREAEHQAKTSIELAQAGAWVEALTHARHACEIEARYHRQLVWQPFREAVERALKTSQLD